MRKGAEIIDRPIFPGSIYPWPQSARFLGIDYTQVESRRGRASAGQGGPFSGSK